MHDDDSVYIIFKAARLMEHDLVWIFVMILDMFICKEFKNHNCNMASHLVQPQEKAL